MQIIVNGSREMIQPCSVQDFIREKKLDEQSLIVEYNFSILKKNQWENIDFSEGDHLELLNFVGGG